MIDDIEVIGVEVNSEFVVVVEETGDEDKTEGAPVTVVDWPLPWSKTVTGIKTTDDGLDPLFTW